MVRADYDSDADALLIELLPGGRFDGAVSIDDTYCHVEMRRGRVMSIELLGPADHLGLLERASERLGLDGAALLAAAKAALAAPNRPVTIDVAPAASSAAA